MNYRSLGKTNWQISEISLGTWQVGGKWGQPFDDSLAERILHSAIDRGVNFIDTADVYSEGLSEKVVGKVVRSRKERVYVATKCGRRLQAQTAEGYNRENIHTFVSDSLRNTGLECLDLVQLHCPPTEVYSRPEVFGYLDELKEQGKILHYGVSVEKVSEAMQAIRYPGVASVQIIFNLFRLKPAETFFAAAQAASVGILARVPLASGMLTGKFGPDSTFGAGDHRHFNRHGEAFDKGETFSGVPYELALQAVKAYQGLFGEAYLSEHALRWILMFEAVSAVIPGASRVEQVLANVKAASLRPLPDMAMQEVQAVYDEFLHEEVHPQW